jgi:hypothetical protein
MIRPMLAPLLGLLAPEILSEILTERSRADAAKGAAAELRSLITASNQALETARDELGQALDGKARAEREIETMRSVLNDCGADNDRLTGEIEHVKRANVTMSAAVDDERDIREKCQRRAAEAESRARNLGSDLTNRNRVIVEHEATIGKLLVERDHAQKHRYDIRDAAKETQADLDAARAEIVRLGGAAYFAADTARPVKPTPSCAWCLLPSEGTYATTDAWGDPLPLCGKDWHDPVESNTANIRARVATRAASCAERRDSADPEAKACTNCMAPAGKPCDLEAYKNETAEERPKDAPGIIDLDR